MVLILTSSGDYSTDCVIDWLKYYQAKFIRLNSEDLIDERFKIFIGQSPGLSITVNDKMVPLHEIKAIWFRKFYFTNTSAFIENFPVGRFRKEKMLAINQQKSILKFIVLSLKDKKWLPRPFDLPLNKSYVVYQALRIGMKIPQTIITNTKEYISSDYEIITKSICDATNVISSSGRRYFGFTSEINSNYIGMIPNTFSPSMIQEKIDKAYELRIFYLCGEIFGMAIFSQSIDQTRVDFRKYNWEKPNRYEPVSVPKELKDKIKLLMNVLKLNTGSLDFIKAKDGNYYFLEINPTGQFGMMEGPCNYPLHKRVAQVLVAMDKG
ncbi:MAG: grasp-with-spasm system ATP-grasp peptide maturase [Lachnospiraceae bacterium]